MGHVPLDAGAAASVLGNEAALRWGRRRSITLIMIASGVLAHPGLRLLPSSCSRQPLSFTPFWSSPFLLLTAGAVAAAEPPGRDDGGSFTSRLRLCLRGAAGGWTGPRSGRPHPAWLGPGSCLPGTRGRAWPPGFQIPRGGRASFNGSGSWKGIASRARWRGFRRRPGSARSPVSFLHP